MPTRHTPGDMSATVREAVLADVPSLDVIRQQAMEDGFTARYARSEFAGLVASADERLPRWIADGDTTVLVAETPQTSTCFGVLEGPTGRLLALYTAPEYQGMGHASTVLHRLERLARAGGATRLSATVPLNAVGFFEHRGFARVGQSERAGLAMVEVRKPIS